MNTVTGSGKSSKRVGISQHKFGEARGWVLGIGGLGRL